MADRNEPGLGKWTSMAKLFASDTAMEVTVEEVFYHCSKAFLRSNLWDPETWRPDELPSRAALVQATERTEATVEELEHHYGPAYLATLY